MNCRRILAGLTLSLLATVTNAQQNAATPSFVKDSLDQYIQTGLKDWNIPGLAISIVKDGKVVYQKGFGVRDIKTNAPVDENTLFIIASNTKLFTGTALAQLEYNKKLSLNDKITTYIKDFRLYDENSTQLATIRDMLTHRIGTKTFQGDFTFWNSNLSRQAIMRRIRLLKPTGLFRQDYGYCNSCYLTAGEMIPATTGQPWEVYVYDSILMPLKMTNTHMLVQGMDQRPNASKAYTTSFTGTLTELPYDRIDNLGPATSMVSNVKDISNWLLAQLDSGRLNGKTVLPWPVLSKTREVSIMTSSKKSNEFPTHFRGYGLGVNVADYNGRQIYYHTGGAFGFVTNTCFVPEEGLGITVLTNMDNQGFFEALRYQVLDAYLGVPFVNRSTRRLGSFQNAERKTLATLKALQDRVKGNNPAKGLDFYTGTYANELYGTLIVTKYKNPGRLQLEFKSHNNLKATLDYLDNDEWLLSYNHAGYGKFLTSFKQEKNKLPILEVKMSDFLEYDPYFFQKMK